MRYTFERATAFDVGEVQTFLASKGIDADVEAEQHENGTYTVTVITENDPTQIFAQYVPPARGRTRNDMTQAAQGITSLADARTVMRKMIDHLRFTDD